MSYIQLDKNAFLQNINYFSNVVGSKDKLCIALKDNAYGHGIELMSKLSGEFGIKHCMVRNLTEANIVAKDNYESILILNEIPKEKYPANYIFSVNSLESLSDYYEGSIIELKIDTGMSRNGILLEQIEESLEIILSNNLILNGVFTHFCCADEDNDITNEQEKLFLQAIKQIKESITIPFRIHCANSAGVYKVDNSLYDMARLGIGLYGYNQSYQESLQPVLSLWADKISTRTLNKDDAIGYGLTYKVKLENTIVSNYDIGYGDGFFRLNERKKAKVQNGKFILGRVSMDSFSLEGDDKEVCIFNDVRQLAKVHDTIEYEILTHLQSHITRTII